MDFQPCLPDPELLALHAVTVQPEVVWLDVQSQAPSGSCPRCGRRSTRRHSHYTRVLKDLALLGRRVRLRLTVHKYFCTTRGCPQRIFCERLPTVVGPWQRQTLRLASQDTWVALEVGAESGARVLARCGCPIGADALLALIRRMATISPKRVCHLRVDDWAWCKGQAYGTILVDLDGHRVVDLLPDREAGSLTAWLRQHPEVELITRDRATAYSEGASRGAPQAQQVADRWHLLKNLRGTLERYMTRVHRTLADLTRLEVPPAGEPAQDRPAVDRASPPGLHAPTARQRARFETVKQRLAQGWPVNRIAREAGVARGTVRKYASLERHPGTAGRPRRRRQLDPHLAWLTEQWRSGQRNAVRLFQQLRAQGYRGGYSMVKAFCHALRMTHPEWLVPHRPWPSPAALSWVILGGAVPTPEVEALLVAGRAALPEFGRVASLLVTGWALIQSRGEQRLARWLGDLAGSGVKELRALAIGIDRDFEAVRAALETPYSNGPVEGHVNRLKTLKRSMYGRAHLDLLRARLLHQPDRPTRHQKPG